jgi:shikimate kinase
MAAAPLNALGRHLALTGFMGAGKSTVGSRVAERLGRPFVDLDAEIERHTSRTIAEIFAEDGEAAFRAVEESVAHQVLDRADPAVVALGGGAVVSSATREALGARAFTVFLETSPETAWERSQATGRPLARDETAFLALYEARRPVYEDVADACASDLDDVLLHAAGIHVAVGAVESMADLVPGDGPIEIVIDRHVSGIHGVTVQLGLGSRDVAVHELPPGEAAKTVAVLEQVWESLRIGRSPSGAERRRTSRASPRRRTCGASRGCRCRRRSSARSTRRSAARPRSTSRAGRTSSERSTGRRA